MGNVVRYKAKKKDIEKLKIYLKTIENGRHQNKCAIGKGK